MRALTWQGKEDVRVAGPQILDARDAIIEVASLRQVVLHP
jgi:hypothetical protein